MSESSPSPSQKRDLKFRTWDDQAKGFIHFTIFSGTNFPKGRGGQTPQNPDETKDPLIQQYVGLKDRFDNEIYEGDILVTLEDSETSALWNAFYPNVPFPLYTKGVVEFVNSSFCLCQEGLGRTPLEKLSSSNPSYALEIVGNIFENPIT